MNKRNKSAGKHPIARTKTEHTLNSNQYVGDPRQDAFLDLYLEPSSPHFANAYQSALAAGFSDATARMITSPSKAPAWITENPRIAKLEYNHLVGLADHIAMNTGNDSVKLKAIELSAKLKGLMIDRKEVTKEVITVSLGGIIKPSATERPIID